jgi:hypothetical protein
VDYSYQVGLTASIWVGGILAVIVFFITVVLVINVTKPQSVREYLLATVTFVAFGALYAIITGLVVFCAAFTILNLGLQYEQLAPTLIPAFIERELSNGVFALRITSLFICYRSLAYIAQLIWVYALHYHDSVEDKRRRRFFDRASTEYPELDRALSQEESGNVRDEDQDLINLSQWGLYAMVLTDLWALRILPLPPEESILVPPFWFQVEVSLLVALLGWALFFVFDDWAIITQYARSLKGRIFPGHARRIDFFNAVLIGPLLILIFQQFSFAFAIISFAVIVIFGFWRYGFKWVTRQPRWDSWFTLRARPPRAP